MKIKAEHPNFAQHFRLIEDWTNSAIDLDVDVVISPIRTRV
jgi:hypothetical protein